MRPTLVEPTQPSSRAIARGANAEIVVPDPSQAIAVSLDVANRKLYLGALLVISSLLLYSRSRDPRKRVGVGAVFSPVPTARSERS